MDYELPFKMKAWLESQEKSFISSALLGAEGCKSQAALLLGLNRTTLVMKMKKYKMLVTKKKKAEIEVDCE